jgi:hypothetical protein
MGNPIGLQVVERPAAIGAEIIPADLANTGVIGEFKRGLENQTVEITSFADAEVRYGGPVVGLYGFYVLRALFENALPYGAKLYVSRVEGAGGVAASNTISSGITRFVSILGTGGDLYAITIETGTLANSKKITFEDQIATPTVTEVYDNILTAAELCDAINRGIGNGTITYELNGGGASTTIVASTLIKVHTAAENLPDNLAQGAMGSTNLIEAPYAAAVDPVVKAGQNGAEDNGTWGNSLLIQSVPSSGAEYQRDITIYELVDGVATVRETWLNFTATDWESKLNAVGSGSRYVAVTTVGDLPDYVLYTDLDAAFAGGTDGATPSQTEFDAGISAFDDEDLQIMTHSDLFTSAWSKSLEEYCQGRGDCVAVSAVAKGVSKTTIITSWAPDLVKQKSFMGMYRAWVDVDDTFGGRVQIPPTGHVVGAGYIRRMFQHTGLPHTAPAGTDAPLNGALDLEVRRVNDIDLETIVHDGAVNQIMQLPGRGFIIRTSRTTSSLSSNYSMHIRRSILFLKQSFLDNLSWLEQQPNDPTTRARAVSVIRAFLLQMYTAGMFEKRGGFENNVQVKCDEENNPIQVVNQRKLIIDITLRFVEIAELVQINLQSTREGILVQEA